MKDNNLEKVIYEAGEFFVFVLKKDNRLDWTLQRCRMKKFLSLLLLFLCPSITFSFTVKLSRASKYHEGIDLSLYYVSEKLDGIRAYWNGRKLYSRQGNPFAAPDWFVADFPQMPLDGELWVKRNGFELVASIVLDDTPHSGWQAVRYMVFDAPVASGGFDDRMSVLKGYFQLSRSPYIELIPQWTVESRAELFRNLERVVSAGGEGLMLRHKSLPYATQRKDALLKLKLSSRSSAIVLAHNQGRGRFAGMLGSLTVTGNLGREFRIGSGFTRADRISPPPVGSTILFRHSGFYQSGKPRSPVFLEVLE